MPQTLHKVVDPVLHKHRSEVGLPVLEVVGPQHVRNKGFSGVRLEIG